MKIEKKYKFNNDFENIIDKEYFVAESKEPESFNEIKDSECFLSYNAKKHLGKIKIELDLDEAFILMRFLDSERKHINIDDDNLGYKLKSTLDSLCKNLHKVIFLKTKSLMYNNFDFIKK